jgi:hypothetical protein
VVVARSAGSRPLGREQGLNPSPFDVGQLFVARRRDNARRGSPESLLGAARAVAPLRDGLVCAAPTRPAEAEGALPVIRRGGEHEAADLRDRERDQNRPGLGSPF